jgi:hypothetical protein
MISLKLESNVTTPNFIFFTFVKNKEIVNIILALQMAQETNSSKV